MINLTKKQVDDLLKLAKHNEAKFPCLLTLNVGGETGQITLYENGQYKIHNAECPVEAVPKTGDSSDKA